MSVRSKDILPLFRSSEHWSGRKPFILKIIGGYIKNSVRNDDLGHATEVLAELVELCSPNLTNEVIGLQCRVVRVEKAERMNIQDFEGISRERNRLADSILKLLDSVCGTGGLLR